MFSPCDLKSRHTKDAAKISSSSPLLPLVCVFSASCLTQKKQQSGSSHGLQDEQSFSFTWCTSKKPNKLFAQCGKGQCCRSTSRSFPSAGKGENSAKSCQAPSETCPSATLRTGALESKKLHHSDKLTYSIGLFN